MTNSTQTQPVVKHPWYVLLATGVLLTGFVAWALVIRALYNAGKRRMAYGLIAINAVIGITLFFGGMTIRLEWWKTELLVMFIDIAWTIAAIAVYQRIPGRTMSLFHVFAWKKMLVPLASAAILGFCLGVTMAIPLAMTQHGALEQSEDILDQV